MRKHKIIIFFKKIIQDLIFIFFFALGLILNIKKKKKIAIKLIGDEKILIISTLLLGDCLFITPFYRELKKKYPNIYLTVVVNRDAGRDILLNNPYIDELVYLENYYNGLKFIFRNIFTYDIILDIAAVYWWSLLFMFLRIKIRFTAENQRTIGHFFITNPKFIADCAVKYKRQYIVNYYLSFLELFGKSAKNDKMEFFLSTTEEKNTLSKFNLNNKKYLVFHLGASLKENIWHKWKFLAKLFLNEFNDYQVIFTGAGESIESQHEIISTLRKKYLHQCIFLAGKTNIRELAAIIKNCSLYVGGDTGATHIAIAAGRNTVMLFGRADSSLFCPPNVKNIIPIRPSAPCYPCYKYNQNYNNCGYEKSLCMETIYVSDVFRAISNLINN
jgi:heptosyltransferase-2/heptosyltransferase-3